MSATVFFADVLGFSVMATRSPGDAERALDDVALLFSHHDEITKYLQSGSPWQARYGLSDSIFLIAADPVAAAAAAAQFFFRLAYLNSSVPEQRVLMRGALAAGEVRELGPIFAETATGNVVGAAVVKAAVLEKSGAKGPRLLVDEIVADAVRKSKYAWLLDDREATTELLWLLPPDPSDFDLTHVRAVCVAASDAFLSAPAEVAEHYVAYVDLVLRSLLRLKEKDGGAASVLARAMDRDAIAARLDALAAKKIPVERRVHDRLKDLAG